MGSHTEFEIDMKKVPGILTIDMNSPTDQFTIDMNKGTNTIETDPTVPSHVKEITEDDISNWNNKSDFSGLYKDLIGIPDEEDPTMISITNKEIENILSKWEE